MEAGGEEAEGGKAPAADGSASPSNLPVRIKPPKPARVVGAGFASPLVTKRRLNDDVNTRAPTRLCLAEGGAAAEDASGTWQLVARGGVRHFSQLLDECKIHIFSFLVESEDILTGPWTVCKAWHALCRSPVLWSAVPTFRPDRTINRHAFRHLGLKNQGTEGLCYKVLHRRSGRLFAMKKARVYPNGEGVPYYMLRELAFLQGLRHPHIATVERISLVSNNLYLFFPYMEKSLFDLINPNNDANGGFPLPPPLIKRFLYQILQGVAFCHQRGVLHRNLKPKHLLVEIPTFVESEFRYVDVADERKYLPQLLGLQRPRANGPKPTEATKRTTAAKVFTNRALRGSALAGTRALLEQDADSGVPSPAPNQPGAQPTLATHADAYDDESGAASGSSSPKSATQAPIDMDVYERLLACAGEGIVRISDFALVRSTSIPLRSYTNEVVTLWYRSPEVLMGGRYFAAVDVWSVGCVFAEMILGKPLFPGICEIDQLFQIFLKLGTPDKETWRGFSTLPNYQFEFPNWKRRPLSVHIPNLEDAGLDLMAKMLTINPDRRITAEAALQHPYFDQVRAPTSTEPASAALAVAKDLQTKAGERSVHGPSQPGTHTTFAPRMPSSASWRGAPRHGSSKEALTFAPMNPLSIHGPGVRNNLGLDPDFPVLDNECGRLDLNESAWAHPDDEGFSTSCWKYSRELHAAVGQGERTRGGLDDPVYLVRYYHYLKCLEKKMYPLQDYMALGQQFSRPAASNAGPASAPARAVGHTTDQAAPALPSLSRVGSAAVSDRGTATQESGTQVRAESDSDEVMADDDDAAGSERRPRARAGHRNGRNGPARRFDGGNGQGVEQQQQLDDGGHEAEHGPAPVAAPAHNAELPTVQEPVATLPSEPMPLVPLHRSMLVDWLVEVIDVFEMSVRSVFMAVNYTDRYLAKEVVARNQFQLLGATCIHIASKCEDVSYIGVDDLVICADRQYKTTDVLKLEERVLNTLDFCICVPTVIDFLNVFIVRLSFNEEEDGKCSVYAHGDQPIPLMNISPEARALAQYLAELSLQEHFFLPKMPSLVAAAAMTLALYYKGHAIDRRRLEAITNYTVEEMRPCIVCLRDVYIDAPLRNNLHVILRRYQKPERFGVANSAGVPDLAGLFELMAA